jgi:hypothetical protein
MPRMPAAGSRHDPLGSPPAAVNGGGAEEGHAAAVGEELRSGGFGRFGVILGVRLIGVALGERAGGDRL